MAEPLKNHFGPAVPWAIAAQIAAVHPTFDVEKRLKERLTELDRLLQG